MSNKINIITKIIESGNTGYDQAIQNGIKLFEGKRARITIEEFKKPRTDKQNRYYWGVVIPILQRIILKWSGQHLEPEKVHQFVKEYIWHWYEDIEVMGGVMRIALPSPKLNTKEWNDKMILTQAWAAERGEQIPDPQEEVPEWMNAEYNYKL